jgi:hypothetical protein
MGVLLLRKSGGNVMHKLSVLDFTLLYIGYWGFDGHPTVTEDDISTFFKTISNARARNILRELHGKRYLHRRKKEKEKIGDTKKTRRGPRGYVYNLTMRGIRRCNYLIGKGYRVWEDKPMRQWDDEDIERYKSWLH